MNDSFNAKDFLEDYNLLLSRASLEKKDNFSSLASPTLNKQETVTFLYLKVQKYLKTKIKNEEKKILFREYLTFYSRLIYVFINLIRISLQFRVKKLPKNCIFLRTWLVPKSFSNHRLGDDYFREMIDDLDSSENLIVGFMPNGFNTLKKLKKVSKSKNYIITPGLLSVKEIFTLIFDYFTNGHIQLDNQYYFKKEDVSFLINKSLTDDYLYLRSFPAFLEKYIANKIKKYDPKVIVYIYENQAWERSLIKVFNSTNTKIIGYQSSGFSTRFLNFFPTFLDKENGYFPDKILTVGDIYTEKLKELGDYITPIETFAALRFNYKCDRHGKYLIQKQLSHIKKSIIYAFPVLIYQYQTILNDLVHVFGNSEIKVDLKFHPLFLGDNLNKITQNLPSNFFIVDHVEMENLNKVYDAVLFNDNSFGIESLINGVPSFEYNLDEGIDDSRLFNFNLYNCKINKDSLKDLKIRIINNTLPNLRQNLVSDYIEKVYTPYESQRNNLKDFFA
jgi:hypothetical protein